MWASDPRFALAWQLKSFYYAYGKNIVGGQLRDAKQGLGTGSIPAAAMPLVMLAMMLLPLTIIGWELRERFKIGLSWIMPGAAAHGTEYDYHRSDQLSWGEWWAEVLDRSGIMGPLALALPVLFEEYRYGKPFFIPPLGPSAERAWDLATGESEVSDWVPIYSSIKTDQGADGVRW